MGPVSNKEISELKRDCLHNATNSEIPKKAASKDDMHPLKRYKIFKTNSIDKEMPVETNPQIEVGEHKNSSSNFITTLHKKPNKQFKAIPSDQ